MCLCSHPSSAPEKQDVLGSALQLAGCGGWEDQSSQLRGVVFQGAWQYGCAVSAASRKSGKPLGEHSGLLLTVTCLGTGKGWSANIALGW